jgi:hypothetical protein
MKPELAVVASLLLLMSGSPAAGPVAVRHAEGLVHGFLTLRTLDGRSLAGGDLIQTTRGDQVTTRLVFHFHDGSTHDETAVYSQRGSFRLISGRLVQQGPAFEQPLEMTIDRRKGQVVVTYRDDEGAEKIETEKMDLPVDLANGMIITLLKNVEKSGSPMEWSYVAATPKPRLVRLEVSSAGAEPFSIAGRARKATHYVLKVDIGGVQGLIAPLIGKQPPDSHVWVLEGEAPAFVKAELAMYAGGPLWRMELTSPVWR